MSHQPFLFVNDWTFSYNGKILKVSREDLDNYSENGLSEDDVKVLIFSYLSKQMFIFKIVLFEIRILRIRILQRADICMKSTLIILTLSTCSVHSLNCIIKTIFKQKKT
jgi:hypothetical protein